MASMSYCVFENASIDLGQIQSVLEKAVELRISLGDLAKTRSSREEGNSVRRLPELLRELLDQLEVLEENDDSTTDSRTIERQLDGLDPDEEEEEEDEDDMD